MKTLGKKISDFFLWVKNFFIKENSPQVSSHTFDTSNQDWDQYNDNVSF